MKLKEKLGVKIAAVILSYVMILILVTSFLSTAVMGYYKFYFSSEELAKEEVLTYMAENEAYYIHRLIDKETNLTRYYKDKNVFYRLTDMKSGEVYDTNYNGEEYFVTASSEYNIYSDYEVVDKYGNNHWESRVIATKLIEVFVAKDMTKSDMFSVMAKIIEIGYSLRFAMVFIVLISLTLSIVLLCYLYGAAGHKAGGTIECNLLDKLPFDILTVIVVFIGVLSFLIVDGFAYNITSVMAWIFIIGSIDYFVTLGFTLSFATRIKTKTLIKNNIIFYILKFAFKHFKKLFLILKYLFSNLSLVYKTFAFICGVFVLEFISIIFYFSVTWANRTEFLMILLTLVNILFVTGSLYISVVLQKIKIGGEKIAQGDLEHKIDTIYMFSDFKSFSNSLNNINEGLQSAVNEKMKSERFKTELITNVSHDIKTPLTSIINYVDLLKKEEINNTTANEYVDVLDRQSRRLKKLVEDLMDASKASTGNVAVNLTECDLNVLLTQALAEFDEKLKKADIKPVLNIPQKSVKIMADGRHLWRVFDNLLNNICKYALPQTRAYFDILEKNDKVEITFRNISRYELNISSDELMERFVRGDTSRNTEGSGLGLSIAKSLVELQNGSMELKIDGDLFKAVIIFDVIK